MTGRTARGRWPGAGLAAAREAAVIVPLGTALAGAALGLLALEYGPLRVSPGDLLAAGAAGVVAAAVVRGAARLHRRWTPALGRFTAAAALCGLAALAGALLAPVPGSCPGGPPGAGRCGVAQAAGWGLTAGVAAALNLLFAGAALVALRALRPVLRDAAAQFAVWLRMAHGRVRSR